MRKALLLLAGLSLLTTSLVAQSAQTATTPFKPAAERKEVTVTEKVLKTYVGEYQLGEDTTRTLVIELKDGYLWGAPPGQEQRQLFPETQTVFFLKERPIELTFKTDAKGVVTGLAMNQNGRTADLTKIK